MHFFPKENVKPTFPEWTERFHFPPALLKLRATVEETIIPLHHQAVTWGSYHTWHKENSSPQNDPANTAP